MKKSAGIFYLLTTFILAILFLPSCDSESGGDKVIPRSEVHDDSHAEHEHSSMGLPHVDALELKGRKLRVAASTNIIGDVVSAIVADNAELSVLMPPGQNPHSWSPTPGEIAGIEQADIIFINGLGLEEELIGILESMPDVIVVPVSAGIPLLEEGDEGHGTENEDEHHHEEGDPHTWFSPLNVIHWVRNIEFALSSADPENHSVYAAAVAEYISVLESLDDDVRDMVDVLPRKSRKLISDHVSIGYFARDYGFDVIGNIIPSMNDQVEPSARQVAALVELVRSEDIRAIFVGGTAGRGVVSLAESVASEAGRDIPVISILSGSLAVEGERGDSYIDFIRYNTELIVAGLDS